MCLPVIKGSQWMNNSLFVTYDVYIKIAAIVLGKSNPFRVPYNRLANLANIAIKNDHCQGEANKTDEIKVIQIASICT